MERFEIIEEGAVLVRVRNLADGDEFSVLRKRILRHDGAWILRSERDHQIREAVKKRQVAKANKFEA
jgi:hypothetical protein